MSPHHVFLVVARTLTLASFAWSIGPLWHEPAALHRIDNEV
jgi:hypothetical protein